MILAGYRFRDRLLEFRGQSTPVLSDVSPVDSSAQGGKQTALGVTKTPALQKLNEICCCSGQ